MTPETISWDLRSSASEKRRSAKLVSVANVDKLKSQLESSPQRAKQPSACANMVAYSPKTSANRDLPLLRSPRAMRLHGVEPFVSGSVDEEYGQIS